MLMGGDRVGEISMEAAVLQAACRADREEPLDGERSTSVARLTNERVIHLNQVGHPERQGDLGSRWARFLLGAPSRGPAQVTRGWPLSERRRRTAARRGRLSEPELNG